jgi:Holliday junction resolvasome RuvABC ATP-dependent DNA helicase subunit
MVAIISDTEIDKEPSLQDLILPQGVKQVLAYELKTGKPFRNAIALAGMGGTGKTALAFAVARQLAATRLILVSTRPEKKEIEFIQDSIIDGAFLFCDEIHGYASQSWLLDVLYGAKGLGRKVEFTSFAATTDRGKLPQTIMNRCPVKLFMQYSKEEELLIAERIASRFNVTLTDDERRILVNASVGIPRTMETLLGFFGNGDMNEAVQLAQLTVDGLDVDCLAMLEYLDEINRPIGRDTLAKVLSAPGGIHDIEMILSKRRYIQPTPGGLKVTPRGKARMQKNRTEGW